MDRLAKIKENDVLLKKIDTLNNKIDDIKDQLHHIESVPNASLEHCNALSRAASLKMSAKAHRAKQALNKLVADAM